ncbi:hypothetical protein DCAR_0730133 [Daucus carota subsp. sativus]|uniref:Uncharacterized protein n=1 Tax=Daucus carota subsp. sativus TaxID=79200 RepID=A0AAF0XPB9_DAUCS|nr:hypothetical protein DCAR_0730133 [Daucus carota subsp. sativus]
MGILNLFLAASMPVLKVLLVTAVGSFLALDRIKILTEDALKHLNTKYIINLILKFIFNLNYNNNSMF